MQLFLFYAVLALGMGFVPALMTTYRSNFALSGSAVANVQNLKDIGLVLAAILAASLIRKLGLRVTLSLAIVAGVVGCVFYVVVPSFAGVLIGAFLHGWAFSLGSICIVTRMFRLQARFRKIGALLAMFGLASVAAPMMVSRLVGASGDYKLVYVSYGLLLIVLLVLNGLASNEKGSIARKNGDHEPIGLRGAFPIAPRILMFGLVMSAETIVVSWITSLLQFGYAYSLAAATSGLSVLWFSHTLSRLASDALAAKLSARVLMILGASIAIVGIALILSTDRMLVVFLGIVVFGIGAAPTVPMYQSIVIASLPMAKHGSANSILSISAAVSTTFVVWGTGFLLDIQPALPFLFAMTVFVLVLVLLIAGRPGVVPRCWADLEGGSHVEESVDVGSSSDSASTSRRSFRAAGFPPRSRPHPSAD